jgi:predicted branched-subunit amino acid permease
MTIAVLERSDSAAARHAVKDTSPFAVALIPFGMAIGGASAAAGLSSWESVFGGFALLAGASQLAAVEMIGSGGGIVSVAIVVALINMRFVLYGTGVARWFAEAPLTQRMALAVPIVDQTFILCQERFASVTDPTYRRRYYLTSTAVLVSAFIVSQVVAFQLGSSLPESLGLHLAAPLAFAGMLARAVKTRLDIIAGAVAAVIVVGGTGIAGGAALPLGVAAGVGAALIGDRNRR